MLIETGPFVGTTAYTYSGVPANIAMGQDTWSHADSVGAARNGSAPRGLGASILTGEELAAYCFDSLNELPDWLLRPGLTLQAAAEPEQPLPQQLACLLQMMDEIDVLFSHHLMAPHWGEDLSSSNGYKPHTYEARTYEPNINAFEPPTYDTTHAAASSTIPRSTISQPAVAPQARQMLPRWVNALFAGGAALLRRQIMPNLSARGLRIMPVTQLDESQRAWLHRYFMQRIYPLLTPLAVDPGHPFPFISSNSVNLLVELRRPKGQTGIPFSPYKHLLARVKIPTTTAPWIAVPETEHVEQGYREGWDSPRHRYQELDRQRHHRPGQNGAHHNSSSRSRGRPQTYVATADAVRFFVHHLFIGMTVRHVFLFRLLRTDSRSGNPELSPRRRQIEQPAVRLDVERRVPEPLLEWLLGHVRLPSYAVAHHDNLLEWLCLPHLATHVIDGLPSPLPGADQIAKVE